MSALRERDTVVVKKDELYGKSSLSIEEEDDGLSYFVSKLTPKGISLPGPDELFHPTISDPYWTSVDSELAIKRANYYWKVLASEGFYSDQREFDEFGLELFPFRHEVIPCNTVRNWSLHHELATFALSKGLESNNLTLIEILRANVECDCKQGIMYEKAGDTVSTKHVIGEPYYLTIKASDDRVYEAQVFCPSVSGNQILEKGIGPSSFEELGVELIQFRPALYYPEIKNPSWWARDRNLDDFLEDLFEGCFMGTGAIPSSPSWSPSSSSSAAAAPPTSCGTESGISTLVGPSSSTAAAAPPTSCGTESGTSRLVGFTPDPLRPSYPVFRRAGGFEAKRAYAKGIGAYASFEAAFVKHHRPEIYAAYEAAYINNKRGVKPKLLAYEAATHIKKRQS